MKLTLNKKELSTLKNVADKQGLWNFKTPEEYALIEELESYHLVILGVGGWNITMLGKSILIENK